MNYSKISQKTANYIAREIKLDNEKQEIIAFAVEILILGAVGFLLILGVGALFNVAVPAFVAAIAGGFLRKLSGGAHFNSPVKCLAFGTVVYITIGIFIKYLAQANALGINIVHYFIILIFSLILVAVYAPVDSEAKPIRSRVLRKRLKLASIVFVIAVMLFVMFIDIKIIQLSVVLGVFYQSLTLLPVFNH